MFRYIWDRVRTILPVSLLLVASGTLCFLLMRHAGEDAASLVGVGGICIGVGLSGWIGLLAYKDVRRWRKDFSLAEAMDEYREAECVHELVRLGKERLFFNTAALEYASIRSMFCTHEHTSTLRGQVYWWYILHAVRLDGKEFRVLLIQDKDDDSKAKATELFTRIIDRVAAKHPNMYLRYPNFK